MRNHLPFGLTKLDLVTVILTVAAAVAGILLIVEVALSPVSWR